MIKLKYSSDWVKHVAKWKRIDDWYDGELDQVLKYLRPHASESGNSPEAAQAWEGRRSRAYNENELDTPLAIHLSHMARAVDFGKAIELPQFAVLAEDVSGYGDSAQDHLFEILELYLLHGRCGVFVEGPTISGEEDREEARLSGNRSFQRIFKAEHIVSFSVSTEPERRGKLKEVLIYVSTVAGEKKEKDLFWRFFFPEGSSVFARQELFSEHNQKLDKDGYATFEEGQTIFGTLDEIPFVIIGKGYKQSRARSGAAANEALFNLNSVRDNINYYQGFKRTIAAGVDITEIKGIAEFQLTVVRNPEAKFHNIEAGDPAAITERIRQIENRTRRRMMFDYNALTTEDTKQVQGADSKSFDMRSRIESYNSILDHVQKKLKKIYQLHAAYEGVDPDSIEIKIPRDFGLDDKIEEQTQLSVAFSQCGQLGARIAQKEIAKQNIVNVLDLPPESMQVILDDIDTASIETSLQVPDIGKLL